MQIKRHANALAASRFDLGQGFGNRAGQGVRAGIDSTGRDVDRGPGFGEYAGRPLANPPAGPGDHRNLALQRLHQNGLPAKKATEASSLTRPV